MMTASRFSRRIPISFNGNGSTFSLGGCGNYAANDGCHLRRVGPVYFTLSVTWMALCVSRRAEPSADAFMKLE
jgi:hypothetical protein